MAVDILVMAVLVVVVLTKPGRSNGRRCVRCAVYFANTDNIHDWRIGLYCWHQSTKVCLASAGLTLISV